MGNISPSASLRQVILNGQGRPDVGIGVIAAEEPHEVRAVVVVVIGGKVEAELSRTCFVDVIASNSAQDRAIPIADRRRAKCGDTHPACRGLEIADDQSNGAEGGFPHIHFEAAKDGKRIGPYKRLFSDLERDLGNDGVIGQGGCIEVEDGAVLFVRGSIAEIEGGGG